MSIFYIRNTLAPTLEQIKEVMDFYKVDEAKARNYLRLPSEFREQRLENFKQVQLNAPSEAELEAARYLQRIRQSQLYSKKV